MALTHIPTCGIGKPTPELFSFTEVLSQVQSLSKEFDQLDKIYADVLDGGDFDWASMLDNKDFKEAFGKILLAISRYF